MQHRNAATWDRWRRKACIAKQCILDTCMADFKNWMQIWKKQKSETVLDKLRVAVLCLKKYFMIFKGSFPFYFTSSAICSPDCQHGGRCLSPGYCTCTAEYEGNRCQIRKSNFYIIWFGVLPHSDTSDSVSYNLSYCFLNSLESTFL